MTLKEFTRQWFEAKLEKHLPARKIQYTLKLTPDAEKFIELIQLPYDERRKRVLDYIGDDNLIQLALNDSRLCGLTLGTSSDPSGKRIKDDIGSIIYGEDHITKLLKLTFPYRVWDTERKKEIKHGFDDKAGPWGA